MAEIATNNVFPTISKNHIKDTFILYNNFVKNAIKYQTSMATLTSVVNDLSNSYEEFINYDPMKAIIDSSGQQNDIYNSSKIYRILYESFKKMSEFLDRDFASPLNDDYKSMQEKFNDKKLEKTLKIEEKQRSKCLIEGVLPEPSHVQRGLFQQYISAVNFVTHKTRKLQFYEIHVFERMVQGMLAYEDKNDINSNVFSLSRSLGRSSNTSNYDNNPLYINNEIEDNNTYHQYPIHSPVNTINSDSNILRENVYGNDLLEMDNNRYTNKGGSTYNFRKDYYHHKHTYSTPNIKYGDNIGNLPSSDKSNSLERTQNISYKQKHYSIPVNNATNQNEINNIEYIESKNNEDNDKKEAKLKLNIKSTLKKDLKKNINEIKNILHIKHSSTNSPFSTLSNKHFTSSLDNESNENDGITTIGKNDSLSKLQDIINQDDDSNDDEEFIVISKKKMDNLIKTGKVHSLDDILKKNKHSSVGSSVNETKSEEITEDIVETSIGIKNDNNNVPNININETPNLTNEDENKPIFAPSQIQQSMEKRQRPLNRHIRSSSYGGFSQSHIRGMSSNLALKHHHYPSIVPNGYNTTMHPHFQSNHSSPLLKSETSSINEDIKPLSKTSKSSIQDLLNNWPTIEELKQPQLNRPVFTRKNSLPIYDRKNPLTASPITVDFILPRNSSPSHNDTVTQKKYNNLDNNNKEYIISKNTIPAKANEESYFEDAVNTTYANENEESSMMINDPTRLIFSKFNTSSSSINNLEEESQQILISPIVADNEKLTNTFEPEMPLRGVSLTLNQNEENKEDIINVEEVKQYDEIEENELVMPKRGVSLFLNQNEENKEELINIEEVKQQDETENVEEAKEAEPVMPLRGVSLFLNQNEEKEVDVNISNTEENHTSNNDYINERDSSDNENNKISEVHKMKDYKVPVKSVITNISSKFSQKLNSMFNNNESSDNESVKSISRKYSVQSDTQNKIIKQLNEKHSTMQMNHSLKNEEIPRRNSSASLKTRKENNSTTVTFSSYPRNSDHHENSNKKVQPLNTFVITNEPNLISTPVMNIKYEDEVDDEETPKIENFPKRPVFLKPQCPITPNAPITPVFPNSKLCDILLNHKDSYSFDFKKPDGNNDIIVISNPLVEVINNKNLVEFKDDLPDECHEFRISRNEAYMSFDLCQEAVEIESIVGSIIDPDEDTSRLEMLNNESFRNINNSLIYKESDSLILSTPKHIEENIDLIQETTEQQPQFESNKANNNKMKKYVALYPYSARDERELSFQRADIINVRKEQGEWVYGYKENLINDEEIKFGWVPKSYLKNIICS